MHTWYVESKAILWKADINSNYPWYYWEHFTSFNIKREALPFASFCALCVLISPSKIQPNPLRNFEQIWPICIFMLIPLIYPPSQRDMPAFVITAFLAIRKKALGLTGLPALFILGAGILSPLALAEVLKPVRFNMQVNPGDFWLFSILSMIFLALSAVWLTALKNPER